LFDELHTRFFGEENSFVSTVESDSRFDLYNIAFNNFKSSPLFGIGQSNYQLINPMHYSNAHNLFINMLIERGLVNFAFFIILLFYLLKYNAKIIKLYPDIGVKKLFKAVKIGIILMLIYGITGDDLFTASGFTTAILSYFLYFIVALHWVYLQRIKSIHTQNFKTYNVQ
jgi:O-antigen ligase